MTATLESRKKYFLEVQMDKSQTLIPVIDIFGSKPGNTLVLVAGLHGDEYEATQTLFKLNLELDPKNISGRIIMITIGNPLAQQEQSRTTPKLFDGKNLAREFPGDSEGTITQRMADKIWKLIADNCSKNDLVIDLHSGGQNYSYVHTAGVRDLMLDSEQTSKSIEAARAMLIPQLCLMEAVSGTLSTTAIEHGIPSIGCEVEGRGTVNWDDVEVYLAGIRNVMKLTGHDTNGTPSITKGKLFRTIEIRSNYSGFATLDIDRFARVSPGDLICRISDGFGENIENVLSPCFGEIWAIRTNPSVGVSEILALIKISDQGIG
jgi:predicted deacylase